MPALAGQYIAVFNKFPFFGLLPQKDLRVLKWCACGVLELSKDMLARFHIEVGLHNLFATWNLPRLYYFFLC